MLNKHLSRILILLLIVQVAIGVFAFPVNQAKAAGRTYYVDSVAGSDSYDGLEQTHTTGTTGPFATIAHINAMGCGSGAGQLAPGDSVLFDSGETWREQLTVPCSGTFGNPITFGVYGSGAMPVISGANVFSSWTTESPTSPWTPASSTTSGGKSSLMWFKADSIAQSNNTAVSSWPDSSGNNHTATQGTGASQPTFKTSQVNSLPGVYFNGSNYLTIASAPTLTTS